MHENYDFGRPARPLGIFKCGDVGVILEMHVDPSNVGVRIMQAGGTSGWVNRKFLTVLGSAAPEDA